MTPRDALEFTGFLSMGVCTLVFAALWWTAFITDNAVRLTITQYSESYPEALIWFFIGPLMLFTAYSYLHRHLTDPNPP